jgi:hypothetical protein
MDPNFLVEKIPKAISQFPLDTKLKLFAIKSLSAQRLAAINQFHHDVTETLQSYHEKLDLLNDESNSLIPLIP